MRRQLWSTLPVGMMLVALLIAGCGDDDESSDAEDLSGTQWQATTIESADALADAPATLALLEDGNIAGTAGCNNYNGVWEGEGDDLTLTVEATTLMACDEAATQQEEAFLQALADTRSFQLDGDSLELHDAEGETLATLEALE